MKLSILIPAKNEQDFIGECLKSAAWADEAIVLLNDSTDKTGEIVRQFKKIKVVADSDGTFASRKNKLAKLSSGDWLFYLDADERITPLLKAEILKTIKNKKSFSAYAVPRRNFLLGKELKYGGWSPDYVIRLFKKGDLRAFVGDLHEQPELAGELGKLTEPLIHLQPDRLEPAFEKSIFWTQIEAQLLLDAHHPSITWWRVLRMGFATLFDRLIKKQGFQDGLEGWIESVYQAYHTIIVYLRLWELQQR